MPNYRRAIRHGGTFFLTLVTEGREPIFADAGARAILRNAIETCRSNHAFVLDALVLLPDHTHLMLTLPEGDSDFSGRIRAIKSRFTRDYLAIGGLEKRRSRSRVRQRTRGVWQRRFWEHAIAGVDDLRRHFDYVHYNPVKHGYVDCPHAWPHSSFHRFVAERRYKNTWCCRCKGKVVSTMEFEDIANSIGE
ncbi:MAG TPA: transposase [Tepidisphaeraceae bacterium]|jgi:putative transposase|nr:transposase [Tepidisphaeraceae bacterium]